MRRTKTQKGITLVALIITIIILLILAVVAIRSITGDGIIGRAQQAKEEYQKKSDEENTTLEGYLSLIESNIPEGNDIISSGEREVLPGEGNTEPTQQIGRDTIAEINSTITGDPYRRTNPIIPAGFKAINTDTSKWDAEGGPQVDNGLVISDGTNEFVWVPVTTKIAAYGLNEPLYREPDVVTGVSPTSDSASGTQYDAVESNLTLAGCIQDLNEDNLVNAYDFKIQLENEFEAMKTSVNKYGGFYVGRYETSINSEKAQSIKNATSATASSSSANTWYGLYALCKTYNTNSVKSSMIWGSQYNAMITWIGEAADVSIGDERNITRITGSVETDKIKNIYDLYGNSSEWIMEAYSPYNRVFRGGDYHNEGTPNGLGNMGPENVDGNNGSRLALYIV